MSTWALTDFSGGLGRFNLKPGVDEGRFYVGTLWGREPFALTLPRRTQIVEGANLDGVMPLGEMGDRFYAAYGTSVQQWDEVAQTMGAVIATLAAAPISQYIAVYQGSGPGSVSAPLMYIPLGDGYQTFDGVTLSAKILTVTAQAFAKFDQRLWALQTNGLLRSSLDGIFWEDQAILDGCEEPVSIFTYLDKADQLALYVVSRSSLWAFDPGSQQLVLTQFRDVFHPDMGRGVTIWHPGEDAYITSGMQVWDWNLAQATPMGPGNGDLPPELRGRVISLASETNSMWGLVEGAILVTDVAEAVVSDTPFDDTFYAGGANALCSVMEWTGFGWHISWLSDSPSTAGMLSAIKVVQAQEQVRSWWGCQGMLHTQLIPREMPTMRSLVQAGTGDFAERGYLDTGWFDAGMRAFDKLASHIEINMDHANDHNPDWPDPDPTAPTTYLELMYALDGDPAWIPLGRAGHTGRTVLPFMVDSTGFSVGMRFNRIRFFIREFTTDSSTSPLMDSLILKFLKLPLSSGAWRATIPLDYDIWKDRSAEQVKADLDALLQKDGFIKVQFGENEPSRRCRLTSLDGTDETGWSNMGRRDIAIAEIALPIDTERI